MTISIFLLGNEEEEEHHPHNNPVNLEMQEKLKLLETKIMFGGENLLEKAERQERQLMESEAELAASKAKEQELQSVLQKRDEEILQIEESYGSLQEEVAGLNKKLNKAFNYLLAAKEELTDCQTEFSQLREDLLDSIRATNNELKLANLLIQECVPGVYDKLIDRFIPFHSILFYSIPLREVIQIHHFLCILYDSSTDEYYSLIQEKARYNESLGDWQLKGLNLAGNNIVLNIDQVRT